MNRPWVECECCKEPIVDGKDFGPYLCWFCEVDLMRNSEVVAGHERWKSEPPSVEYDEGDEPPPVGGLLEAAKIQKAWEPETWGDDPDDY